MHPTERMSSLRFAALPKGASLQRIRRKEAWKERPCSPPVFLSRHKELFCSGHMVE
jgi:hypothetical protein